jgi:glycosyltransferase involved in cell wall biosynthesis
MHVPFLYAAVHRPELGFAGGSELQVGLLSRGLAARGFEVSVVSLDVGQPDVERRDGVTHLRSYRSDDGLPVVRFFVPRLTRSIRALRAARADVYYMRGSGVLCGVTYEVARRAKAPFVLAAAHDHDVRADLPFAPRPWERWWHRRAIAGARLLIAQTAHQQTEFRRVFGVGSEVVPNLVELPPRTVDAGQDGAVVWLGTWKPSKRPEWFIELARRMPRTRFVMRGVVPVPPLSDRTWRMARDAAGSTPNLEVGDAVEHSRLAEFFGSAALFVHTSDAEGFPNTLLESWAHGIPSVSAVDPDGTVASRGLGEVATTWDGMLGAVTRWLADPEARRAAGRRARAWVELNHAPGAVLDRFAALLDPLVAESPRRR